MSGAISSNLGYQVLSETIDGSQGPTVNVYLGSMTSKISLAKLPNINLDVYYQKFTAETYDSKKCLIRYKDVETRILVPYYNLVIPSASVESIWV